MRQLLALLLLLGALRGGDEARSRATDLRKLGGWIDVEQGFSAEKRGEARAAVTEHLEREHAFTDAAFYLEVRRIVALADNGHSNADDTPIFERFGLLPVRTYWFADGLYIVRARESQRGLLGARVERVEGRTIAEVEKRLQAYCGPRHRAGEREGRADPR